MPRILSVRLVSDEIHADLEAVARVDGVSVAEAVRCALSSYIDLRRADPDFQERRRKQMTADREELERLAVSET